MTVLKWELVDIRMGWLFLLKDIILEQQFCITSSCSYKSVEYLH